jgi:hypothetical protein
MEKALIAAHIQQYYTEQYNQSAPDGWYDDVDPAKTADPTASRDPGNTSQPPTTPTGGSMLPTAPATPIGSTGYMIGSTPLYHLGTVDANSARPDCSYFSSLTETEQAALLEQERQYADMLTQKYGSNDGWAVRYTQNTTTGVWYPQFYKLDDLKNAYYDDNTGVSQSHIRNYVIGSEKKTEEVKNVKAKVEQDSTGRLINLTLFNDSDNSKVTFALTTKTVTDQEKYNDAMNQYEYAKYQYDQMINDINNKIAIIQQQDKNLELRLKQLDTEQNAIATEMEAVSKIIQKNVETTFKTFG